MAKQGEGTVLDAINEALGTAGEPHANDNTGADDGADDEGLSEGGDAGEEDDASDAGDEGTGDDAGEEGEDSEGEGAETPEAKAAAATLAKSETDKAAETPEAKAAAAAAAKAAAKKEPDAINDPIPKDLKQETRQRMTTLVETAKTLTQERDKITGDFNMLVGGLQNAGVSPAQYGETLNWLALFNSQDPVQQGQALDLVEGIADRLATLLGRDRAVNDPLKNHPDLVQAITNRTATKEIALEVARTRNANKFRGELQTTANTAQQQQNAAQQATEQARTDLVTLETTLRATDPQYERKKAQLVPILKPIFKTLPPSQWKASFEAAYANVRLPGVGRPAGARPNLGQQPLRANRNPAGGQSRQASSPLEALNGALNSMGGK